METYIIPKASIDELVLKHDEAQKKAKESLETLLAVQKNLASSLGSHLDYVFPSEYKEMNWKLRYSIRNDVFKDVHNHIKRNFWKYLFDSSKIATLMSPEDREKVYSFCYKKEDVPDFTHENIDLTFSSLYNQKEEIFQQKLKSLYRWLRPCSHAPTHVTNKEAVYRLPTKVIVVNAVERFGFGGFFVSHNLDTRFDDLELIFCAFTGEERLKEPHNLATQLRNAINNGQEAYTYTRESFGISFRWYKNGNLHIKFNCSQDLLSEIDYFANYGSNKVTPGTKTAA